MGMYDHLYVEDLSLLPLSDEERSLLSTSTEWQTKSLDSTLTDVFITPNRRLEVLSFEYEEVPKEERPYPDDDGFMGMIGSLRRVNERRVDTGHHGYLSFYTRLADELLEFRAKFTDGVMVGIERVSPKYDNDGKD
jgi:hypothetical protein